MLLRTLNFPLFYTSAFHFNVYSRINTNNVSLTQRIKSVGKDCEYFEFKFKLYQPILYLINEKTGESTLEYNMSDIQLTV